MLSFASFGPIMDGISSLIDGCLVIKLLNLQYILIGCLLLYLIQRPIHVSSRMITQASLSKIYITNWNIKD